MVYESTLSAELHQNSDVDTLTIDLDAGQTLSLAMLPQAALAGQLRVLNPSDTEIATHTAAAGDAIVVQTVPIATAGTYKVEVASDGSTSGTYDLELYLNALLEAESYNGRRKRHARRGTRLGFRLDRCERVVVSLGSARHAGERVGR